MAEVTRQTEPTVETGYPTRFQDLFRPINEQFEKKENEIQKLKKQLDAMTRDLESMARNLAKKDQKTAELEREVQKLDETAVRLDEELRQAHTIMEERTAAQLAVQEFLGIILAGSAKYQKYHQILSNNQLPQKQTIQASPEPSSISSRSSSLPVLEAGRSQYLQNNTANSHSTESRAEKPSTVVHPPDKSSVQPLDVAHTSQTSVTQVNEVNNANRLQDRSEVISEATNEPNNSGDDTVSCSTVDSDDRDLSPPRKRPRTEGRENSHCNGIIVSRLDEWNLASQSQQMPSQGTPEQVIRPKVIPAGFPLEARAPVAQMLPQAARDALSHLRMQSYAPTPARTPTIPLSRCESFPTAIEWDQKLDKTTVPPELGYELQQEVKKLVAQADTDGVKLGSPSWRESFFGSKPLSSCLYSRILGRHSPDYLPPLPGTQTYPAPRPSNPNATRPSRLALNVACRHCFEDRRPCVNGTGERVVVLPLHETLRMNHQKGQLQYWIKSS